MYHQEDARDLAEGGFSGIQGRELLPNNVRPLHYTLTLEPNLEDFTFKGSVTIE